MFLNPGCDREIVMSKLVLDTPGFAELKRKYRWISNIDVLPYNAIVSKGRLIESWSGADLSIAITKLNFSIPFVEVADTTIIRWYRCSISYSSHLGRHCGWYSGNSSHYNRTSGYWYVYRSRFQRPCNKHVFDSVLDAVKCAFRCILGCLS